MLPEQIAAVQYGSTFLWTFKPQMYKPVILLGNGMRGRPDIVAHLRTLNAPILTTWMGADLIAEDDPAFCGRPGIFGQRAANIIQQKATHLYCFGARLDGEQVAYDYDRFAPNATIYVCDIDEAEWQKFPPRYHAMGADHSYLIDPGPDLWLDWCKALYNRFAFEWVSDPDGKYVSPFEIMDCLSLFSRPDDVFAIGSSGNAPNAFFQTFRVQAGQRISNVCTIGAMGADIPMALGAALATGKRVICVTGDGGFQLNAQELETIYRLHLPITFFVLNNNGYASIRTMQDVRFDGRRMGSDPKSGLTLPSLDELAFAYRFPYQRIWAKDLDIFGRCFDFSPMVVEVMVDPEWRQLPRVMASTVDGQLRTDDMQDLTPKLDPEELAYLMEWDG